MPIGVGTPRPREVAVPVDTWVQNDWLSSWPAKVPGQVQMTTPPRPLAFWLMLRSRPVTVIAVLTVMSK